ncbi:MAG: cell division protein ZapA [Clostridia bacterium]|nr:cell division protein ZapA [Clostridia bacterium]
MRQKFTIQVADVQMNIACEESREVVDAAVAKIDAQVRALVSNKSAFCTKTEAALLTALDLSTQVMHLEARVAELEEFLNKADPEGNTVEVSLLRGENETLRAELQISRDTHDALLQDNATLFGLNAKLVRQSNETNARADRMHDQVLSILSEVRELRERLAALCGVAPRDISAAYTEADPEPGIEVTPEEQQVTRKYEQMDLDEILQTAPRSAPIVAERSDD